MTLALHPQGTLRKERSGDETGAFGGPLYSRGAFRLWRSSHIADREEKTGCPIVGEGNTTAGCAREVEMIMRSGKTLMQSIFPARQRG